MQDLLPSDRGTVESNFQRVNRVLSLCGGDVMVRTWGFVIVWEKSLQAE